MSETISVAVAPSPARVPRLRARERRELAALFGIIGVLPVAGWTLLAAVVVPQQLDLGGRVFGLGLGVTAYTLGVRHAFDADHIAAIDNTTRQLLRTGRRPVSVGFWFALGHSTIVVLLAAGVAAGARYVVGLTDGRSGLRQDLGVVGAGVSGLFLYLIGVLNLVALIGLVRYYRRGRAGSADAAALEGVAPRTPHRPVAGASPLVACRPRL